MGMRRDVILARLYSRDVQRCRSGKYKAAVEIELEAVVSALASNIPLSEKYKDHALSGSLSGYRDCHIKPDLILIYEIADNSVIFHRLGSHSEIFDVYSRT